MKCHLKWSLGAFLSVLLVQSANCDPSKLALDIFEIRSLNITNSLQPESHYSWPDLSDYYCCCCMRAPVIFVLGVDYKHT